MNRSDQPAPLTGLSPEQVGFAVAAREREADGPQRREVLTEGVAAAGFLAAAAALWVATGTPAPGALGVWLALLCFVFCRVTFDVGEGSTRPVVLAVVPMLMLLPAGVVPLLVAGAAVAARTPEVFSGRMKAYRLTMAIADSWFVLGPALLFALVPEPASHAGQALLVLAALAAQFAGDFAISGLRIWAALGVSPREDLRAYVWVDVVDFLLAPVGLLAAWAADESPLAAGALLPLAGLLAVFAHERRGRMENAVALQRVTEESRDRLQSIVQHASDLILIVDPGGRLETVTGSTELAADAGASLLDVVHADDAERVAGFLAAAADKPAGESAEAEWRMLGADGAHRHVSAVATNLIDDARVGGIVLTVRDDDARKRFEQQLQHRAFHDELTGLANRALFYDRTEHALARGSRDGSDVAVLFVDLDDFKPVNDRLGHAAGDQLLQLVAKRLSVSVRAADTVARLGGDEFGILLEGADRDFAVQAAERVLAALETRFDLPSEALRVSASVGVAVTRDDVREVEDLLRAADRAMYDAKRSGKRRLAVHDGSAHDPDVPLRLFTSTEAQRAEIVSVLEDPDAISMVFQPVLDLRTGRVAAYEALARFSRVPVRSPDRWFADAQRVGLGAALEARALAEALAVPGRPRGTRLTLNLSLSSLGTAEIQAVLPERLDDFVIEVTENELAVGDPATQDAIAALRARGAALAVDDTGAGYAGLTHVMRLAPDVIKLDRALTTGIDTDPVKAALVSSFVRYAREIDATVCAEGIETAEELARLADLDVAYGQGFHIGRPSPPWIAAEPGPAAACRASFRTAFAEGGTGGDDERLERLMRDLGAASGAAELEARLRPMADLLGADDVRIVAGPASARQVLAADAAELREAGFGAMLVLPIGSRAHLVAYSRNERPWTRFHLGRGRIITHQLRATLPG